MPLIDSLRVLAVEQRAGNDAGANPPPGIS
jgi:hypothetical protein